MGIRSILRGTNFLVNIMQATDNNTQLVNTVTFRGQWADIIIVNAQVPTGDKTGDREFFMLILLYCTHVLYRSCVAKLNRKGRTNKV
jgi:hypothetical protein